MQSKMTTEFTTKELEVIFAALDHFIKYTKDYKEKLPVIVRSSNSSTGWDLDCAVDDMERISLRVQEIIATAKSVKALCL